MKTIKRLSALMIVMAVLASVCAVSASASSYLYATGSAHIRKGAGLDYSSIMTVDSGTKMEKLGSARDDRYVLWYKVKVNGKTGWISQLYVSSSRGGSATKGKVTLTGKENIRYRPNKNSESLGTIASGTSVSYYTTAEDSRGVTWYLIRYDGDTGWISSKNTKKGSSSKTKYILADDGQSHIRKGPGLDYKTIGTLPYGETAVYEGSTKTDDRDVDWYKISYDDVTGWVSSRYTRMITR